MDTTGALTTLHGTMGVGMTTGPGTMGVGAINVGGTGADTIEVDGIGADGMEFGTGMVVGDDVTILGPDTGVNPDVESGRRSGGAALRSGMPFNNGGDGVS